jgi:hypothetical protein
MMILEYEGKMGGIDMEHLLGNGIKIEMMILCTIRMIILHFLPLGPVWIRKEDMN